MCVRRKKREWKGKGKEREFRKKENGGKEKRKKRGEEGKGGKKQTIIIRTNRGEKKTV